MHFLTRILDTDHTYIDFSISLKQNYYYPNDVI